MAERVLVRSNIDNHVLFSLYKSYYPSYDAGEQKPKSHFHSELEISCILTGSGEFYCNGVSYPFSPGDVFYHCGNDPHYFTYLNAGDMPSVLSIRFDPSFIWLPSESWSDSRFIQIFNHSSPLSRRIPCSAAQTATICELLNDMYGECERMEPAYELIVRSKLLTVLACMVRYFNAELNDIGLSNLSLRYGGSINSTMNYIRAHLDEPLSLDDLAKEAHMSRSYFCTVFKSLNSLSVWDYIISQRIDRAEYLLETTDDTIFEICAASGFSSLANFNRTFKRLTGKTPSEYRLSSRRGESVQTGKSGKK